MNPQYMALVLAALALVGRAQQESAAPDRDWMENLRR